MYIVKRTLCIQRTLFIRKHSMHGYVHIIQYTLLLFEKGSHLVLMKCYLFFI